MTEKKLNKVIRSFINDCKWALSGPTGTDYCRNLSDAKILGRPKVDELIAEMTAEITRKH
jgi:hypothetical protein